MSCTSSREIIESNGWVNTTWDYNPTLAKVTIGKSVTSIGSYAFSGCTAITRIDSYPNPDKVSMGGSVFYNVPKENTLHVPSELFSKYQVADQWKEFTNIAGDLTEQPLIGDINGDNAIDVRDVTSMISYILGATLPGFDKEYADLNNDDNVNVQDVTALINMILN